MKISFVIPTLNFAEFLPDALNSIINEGCDLVEIVVFDGGSTDNTLEVLERYRAKFPDLKVVSATERGNIDIDLNKGVAAATGDYIWTMSADDALMPGWSRIVAKHLERGPDLLLVPAVHCDIGLRPRRNYPILRDEEAGELIETLANDEDLIAYLSKVRTSEGLFSFCSACIVRRDKLLQAPELDRANGTCWRYSARLIAVLADFPSTINILNKPLILKRGDNDSFADAGLIRRLKIATINWDHAIDAIGLGRRVSEAMQMLVKSDIRPATLMYLSQFIGDSEEQAIYNECVRSRLGKGGRYERALAPILERMPRVSITKNAILTAKAMYMRARQRLWKAHLPAVTDLSNHARSP